MTTRLRLTVLSVLIGVVAVWLVVSTEAAAQRRDDPTVATQAAIDRAVGVNTNAITEIRGEVRRITDIATDARDEVRSMRNALWGLASVLLISLLMQAIQIKNGAKDKAA